MNLGYDLRVIVDGNVQNKVFIAAWSGWLMPCSGGLTINDSHGYAVYT